MMRGAAAMRIATGADRHVFYRPQPHCSMLIAVVHDTDDLGVDAVHLVDVDDRLIPGHIHNAVNPLHVLGAPRVVVTRDVFVYPLGLVVICGRDRPATTVMPVAVAVAGACSGRGTYQN